MTSLEHWWPLPGGESRCLACPWYVLFCTNDPDASQALSDQLECGLLARSSVNATFREMKHHKIEPKLGDREKEARASCRVRVTCICWCPFCPTSLRKGKKTEVAFAHSENLEWIPLLCVDVEIFLFNDPCPTSWRICSSNLVAVKPSLSHPRAPGVPLVLGSAKRPWGKAVQRHKWQPGA